MKKAYLFLLLAGVMFACTAPVQPEQKPDNQDEQNPGGETNPGDGTNPGGGDKPGDNTPDFSPEPWYETNYWERTDREKMGLRGPVKSWVGVNWSYPTIYEFDREGHLISERSTSNEKWDKLTLYTYDDKGRLIKSESCTHVGKDENELPDYNPANNPDYDWAGREVYEFEYNNPGKYVLVSPDINGFRSRGFCSQGDPRESISPIVKDLSAIKYYYINYAYESIGHIDTDYIFEGDVMSVYSHSYDREVVTDWIIDEYTLYDDDGNIIGGGYSGKHEGDIIPETINDYTLTGCVYKNNYPYSFMDERFGGVTSVTWADNGMPLRIEGTDGITEYYPGKRHINIKKWTCAPGKPADLLLGFSYWYEYTIDENEEYAGFHESLMADDSRIREFKWYDYVYDSYGNWTQYTYDQEAVFAAGTDGKSTYTIKRQIEYY